MARRLPRFVLVALLFPSVSCVQIANVPATREPASQPEPKRALVLVLDHWRGDIAASPALLRLQRRGVSFATPYAGAIPPDPAVGLLALLCGKLPKYLPWQDELFVDTRGHVGRAGGVHRIASLSAAKRKALVTAHPVDTSLATLVKLAIPGPAIAVAPDDRTAQGLSAQSFDEIRVASAATPGAVADSLTATLDALPAFRVLVGVFPGSDPVLTDAALTRVIDKLEAGARFADTIVVATAAAGAMAPVTRFYGDLPRATPPPVAWEALFARGDVRFAVEDTSLRLWLKKRDSASLSKFAQRAHAISGVAEVYAKHDTGKSIQYVRSFRNRELQGEALRFAKDRHLELLNAVATRATADIVVLPLSPGQETWQRIPLILAAPQLTSPGAVLTARARLVDVTPLILRLLGVPGSAALDGTDQGLETALPKQETRLTPPAFDDFIEPRPDASTSRG